MLMASRTCKQPPHPLVAEFFTREAGLSLNEAVAKSGLSRDTIIHWRTGRVRPKLAEFEYLLSAYGYKLKIEKEIQ